VGEEILVAEFCLVVAVVFPFQEKGNGGVGKRVGG
jgi:hypothetical protein